MAGMLPGVECARRRRFHQSGGWSDSPGTAGHGCTRRSSFCLYASSHESHLSSSSLPGEHEVDRVENNGGKGFAGGGVWLSTEQEEEQQAKEVDELGKAAGLEISRNKPIFRRVCHLLGGIQGWREPCQPPLSPQVPLQVSPPMAAEQFPLPLLQNGDLELKRSAPKFASINNIVCMKIM